MQTATSNDRTLGTIFKELTTDITTLFRSEVALLKLEVKDTVTKLTGGATMVAGAAILGFLGLGFAFVTVVLGLIRLGVDAWISTLVVTILLLVVAGILAMIGKKKFAAVNFVPNRSVDQIKGDIESIKADLARVRSRND